MMRPMVSWAVCCLYDRLYMSTHWYKQAGGFERKKKKSPIVCDSNTIYCIWSKYAMKSQCKWVLLQDLQSCTFFIVRENKDIFKTSVGVWRGKMLTPACKMNGFSSYREIFSCPLAFISSGGRSRPRDLQHKHSSFICQKRITPSQDQRYSVSRYSYSLCACMCTYEGWRGHNAICYPLCFSLLHYSSRCAESI